MHNELGIQTGLVREVSFRSCVAYQWPFDMYLFVLVRHVFDYEPEPSLFRFKSCSRECYGLLFTFWVWVGSESRT